MACVRKAVAAFLHRSNLHQRNFVPPSSHLIAKLPTPFMVPKKERPKRRSLKIKIWWEQKGGGRTRQQLFANLKFVVDDIDNFSRGESSELRPPRFAIFNRKNMSKKQPTQLAPILLFPQQHCSL